MGIVTKGQIEKCREMLRDVEHYISPMVLGACEKLKEKSISFIKVRPGSLKRADICYYGFDVEEYVKVNFSITYQIHGNPTGLAEGFAVTFMIDICADVEDLVYHYDDILDIKDNNQEKAKTISLRPIDDITKEYLCEQAVRDAPIVKEYYDELMRIVEKADEYLKKYYKKKSIYVGSHYRDISIYRNGVYGQPENYKEYFMDMLLLAKTKTNMGHTVEKITDMAKERGVEISLTIDEIKKHIEFKNKHGYKWIGPFCKVLDTNLIEAFGYSKNASHLLLVEDFENALYPDRPKKITYDDGSYYEGKMKDGIRHGEGTYYWKNGNKYVGEWKNGKREGQGTYYWKKGSKYVGEWKNSERHGKGVIYYKNGVKEKVVFENGECLKKTVIK